MPWAPRRISLSTVANLRDVGGAPIAGGGAIRDGVLFRSTQFLASVSPADREALKELKLGLVVDLRTSFEIELAPDVKVAGEYLWLDVLRDSVLASQASMDDIFTDPGKFAQILSDGTAGRAHAAGIPGHRRSAERARSLRPVAARSRVDASARPGALHERGGRPGWAVALALLSVGVSQDDVMTDYLTDQRSVPAGVGVGLRAGRRAWS